MISKDLIKSAKYLALDGINNTIEVTCNPDNWRYYVPIDEGNYDYQEWKLWTEDGGVTTEANSDPLTWDDIRATRDKILRDTDWTMTTGATVDQAQWAAYRQNLRDLPQTYKDKTSDDVVWPTQPSTAGPNT